MKKNNEKIRKLVKNKEHRAIFEALGFSFTENEVLGTLIVENFEDGHFEMLNPIREKGHFNFEYSFTSEGVFQVCIYLGTRLMFVWHSGDWANIYSLPNCNFDTGKGLVSDGKKWETFKECIENRNSFERLPAEETEKRKAIEFSRLSENLEQIKKSLEEF